MKIKHHLKFNVADAKQLGIALISSYGMWAATGFQRTLSGLLYPVMGFVTGGLASHHSVSDPGVMPENHIETPYVNNMVEAGTEKTITPAIPQQTYQNVKIIPKTEGDISI
jgi:hypothetical protein